MHVPRTCHAVREAYTNVQDRPTTIDNTTRIAWNRSLFGWKIHKSQKHARVQRMYKNRTNTVRRELRGERVSESERLTHMHTVKRANNIVVSKQTTCDIYNVGVRESDVVHVYTLE